jgi:hypothetical protein
MAIVRFFSVSPRMDFSDERQKSRAAFFPQAFGNCLFVPGARVQRLPVRDTFLKSAMRRGNLNCDQGSAFCA